MIIIDIIYEIITKVKNDIIIFIDDKVNIKFNNILQTNNNKFKKIINYIIIKQ